MRHPLVAPLAAIAAGILVARFVDFGWRELLLLIAAFFFLGLLGLWRGARALAAACCLLGLLAAGALTAVAHRPGPAPELETEGPLVLSGCVVEPPVISGDRERFTLELEPGARVQVTMYLAAGEQPPRLAYGQRLEFDAKVRRPHNFANPGSFDYARYLARKHVYWTASTRPGTPLKMLPGACGSAFTRAVMSLRVAAMERIERLYHGDPYDVGMMQAILIGESFQLQRVWTEQFRSTGTFHAIVISGTHIAVLAAFLLSLLRACFVPPGAARLITVLATWLYTLVTGWQPPCVRSAAGLTLFLIGGYFYRERRVMNLLAAIAIGFLVLDPEQMFEPSFQLSFLAVGFIGAFASPLLQRTSAPLRAGLVQLADAARDVRLSPRAAQFRIELRLLAEALRALTRLPERASLVVVAIPAWCLLYIYELVLISAIVQAGLALPMIVYFHRVGFSGLSANAFIVPLFGAIIPIGFIAVFTGWQWVAQIAGLLLTCSRAIVERHAGVEPNWRIPTPPLWLAVALAAALIAAAIFSGRRAKAAFAIVTAALLALMIWHPFAPEVAHNQLELTAIDVGQGDSLLVAFPTGKLIIVDGGGIAAFGRRVKSQIDIGEDVVSPYLWQRSIRYLDVVALTHAHEDHIGGLAALLENFHVRELWTGATPDSLSWNTLRASAARHGVKVVTMSGGHRLSYGGTRIEILGPPPDYVPADSPKNNDSLAMRVTFGANSFLLTGDMEKQIESELAGDGVLAPVDVLKVAHHGSRTSSTPAFLDLVRPAFAVISAGYENSYGHPHPDVLARLSERRVAVFRTDRDGLVSIRSDGRRIRVETARAALERGMLYAAF